MTTQGMPVSVGYILEDEGPLSIDDLCRLCAVERQFILELAEEGVLEILPSAQLHFVGRSLQRARLAGRLRRDLGVNVAGSALIIELLERIYVLEQRRRGSGPEG